MPLAIKEPFVYLNIGANLQPLIPPNSNKSVAVVAFEPIVYAGIPPRKRMHVVPAAVGSEDGLATMGIYGANGLSSSLSAPASGLKGSDGRWQYVETKVDRLNKAVGSRENSSHQSLTVPVMSMASVLRAVQDRGRRRLWFAKTDMQGHDFEALRSAGADLRAVPYVMAEVAIENNFAYDGVANDYCRDHLPHMLSLGYSPVGVSVARGRYLIPPAGGERSARNYCDGLRSTPRHLGKLEGNAFWQLNTSDLKPPPETQWPAAFWRHGARNSTGGLHYIDGTGYTKKDFWEHMYTPPSRQKLGLGPVI